MANFHRESLLKRALFRCEYCHIPAEFLSLGLQIEHIIARQHGGGNDDQNLAIACAQCNAFKGPNLAGIDPNTELLTRLFNPRIDVWARHFQIKKSQIIGRTPVGRTTVRVLDMNNPAAQDLRRSMKILGIKL